MDNSHEVLVPIILDAYDLDGIRTDGLIPAYRIEGCGRLERRSVSLIGSSKTHIKGRSLIGKGCWRTKDFMEHLG